MLLPTGRSGRFSSGLRVTDFMRRTSLMQYHRTSLPPGRAGGASLPPWNSSTPTALVEIRNR